MIDLYLRGMTGTNRGLIFNAYYYTAANRTITISLIVSWLLNLVLLFLVVTTVLRLKNKPLELNRKNYILFIVGIITFVFIEVLERILPTTAFYQRIYIINHVHIHGIIYMITDWISIIISLALIVNIVRYYLSRKAINVPANPL